MTADGAAGRRSSNQGDLTSQEPTGFWDAGGLGCGELVIELRQRLGKIPPGALFELLARDPGVPEDLPAWCRMTGHALVGADHPRYLIRRKET